MKRITTALLATAALFASVNAQANTCAAAVSPERKDQMFKVFEQVGFSPDKQQIFFNMISCDRAIKTIAANEAIARHLAVGLLVTHPHSNIYRATQHLRNS